MQTTDQYPTAAAIPLVLTMALFAGWACWASHRLAVGQDVRGDLVVLAIIGGLLLYGASLFRNLASRARAVVADQWTADELASIAAAKPGAVSYDPGIAMRRRAGEADGPPAFEPEMTDAEAADFLARAKGAYFLDRARGTSYPATWPPHAAAFPNDDDPKRTGELIQQAMTTAQSVRGAWADRYGRDDAARLSTRLAVRHVAAGGTEELDVPDFVETPSPPRASHHHGQIHQTAPMILVCAAASKLGDAVDEDGERQHGAKLGDFARMAAAYALPADAAPRAERMRKHAGCPAFWPRESSVEWAPPGSRLEELAIAGALILAEMEALIASGDTDAWIEAAEADATRIDAVAGYLSRFYEDDSDALLIEMVQELDDMLGAAADDPAGIAPESWLLIGMAWRDVCIAMGIDQPTYMHQAPEHWDAAKAQASDESEDAP